MATKKWFSKEIEETENRIMRQYDLPEGFIDKFREKFYQDMLPYYKTKTSDKAILRERFRSAYIQALIYLEDIYSDQKGGS